MSAASLALKQLFDVFYMISTVIPPEICGRSVRRTGNAENRRKRHERSCDVRLALPAASSSSQSAPGPSTSPRKPARRSQSQICARSVVCPYFLGQARLRVPYCRYGDHQVAQSGSHRNLASRRFRGDIAQCLGVPIGTVVRVWFDPLLKAASRYTTACQGD